MKPSLLDCCCPNARLLRDFGMHSFAFWLSYFCYFFSSMTRGGAWAVSEPWGIGLLTLIACPVASQLGFDLAARARLQDTLSM